MKKQLVITVASLLWIALAATISAAKDPYPHKTQIANHPTALEIVEAREMKFLIDPAKVGYEADKGLALIWEKVKDFAKRENFTVQEKSFDPSGLTYSTKVYYDTPKGELADKGYVVRITTKYKEGNPDSAKLTVKFIDRDHPETVFTSMPEEEEASIEENVGPAANYSLDTYLEKATKAGVDLAKLPVTLGDFATLIPLLGELGLDNNTKLEGIGAYSIRMKPGAVILPGMPFPAGISMEAWLPVEGGDKAFVYDFSFGYPTGDYYDMEKTHTTAEDIIQKMYEQLDKEMGLPNNAEYRGSKVGYLRKGGLKLEKYSVPKADKRYYKTPQKAPAGVVFNDDPS